MPKVTVVIPTYNSGHFLGDSIQSVLTQTFQDFEIIIVDDGSTDNTKEVVQSFTDLRLGYVYQENEGVSVARNYGFRLSSGNDVIFLDSDDVLLQDTLRKCVNVLDNYPEAGLCYGQVNMMDEDGYIFRVRKSSFAHNSGIVDQKNQIRELLFTCRITTSAALIRHQCLNEVGAFHEKLRISEDRHMFIRIAKKFPVAYLAEPLIKYRVHTDQLHKQVDPKVAEMANLLILQEVFDDPELAPDFESIKGQAYSHSYRRIAGYAGGKNMEMTRRYLRKAIKVYPQILLQNGGLLIIYKYIASLLPNKLRLALRESKSKIFFRSRLKRLREE
jgi:glycosyltransferase involved in cell wall biosynthesis